MDLHLGNIQKAARSHKWNQAETTTPPNDDLVRLPANSMSRFSLTEEQAPAKQHKYCTSFLASIGPNHDLITRPRSLLQTSKNEQYVVPDEQLPIIPQHPEDLAADMFRSSKRKECIYTVEDKDPTALWQMSSSSIFTFWYKLMQPCPQRWEILSMPTAEVLKSYREILDHILPPSLYAYLTKKLNAPKMPCSRVAMLLFLLLLRTWPTLLILIQHIHDLSRTIPVRET